MTMAATRGAFLPPARSFQIAKSRFGFESKSARSRGYQGTSSVHLLNWLSFQSDGWSQGTRDGCKYRMELRLTFSSERIQVAQRYLARVALTAPWSCDLPDCLTFQSCTIRA